MSFNFNDIIIIDIYSRIKKKYKSCTTKEKCKSRMKKKCESRTTKEKFIKEQHDSILFRDRYTQPNSYFNEAKYNIMVNLISRSIIDDYDEMNETDIENKYIKDIYDIE